MPQLGNYIDRQLKIYTSRPGAKNAGCWGKLPLEEKLRKLRSFIITIDIPAAWLQDKYRTVGKRTTCSLDRSEVKVWLHKM